MTLAYAVHRAVVSLDPFLSAIQLQCFERKGCLMTVFFHSLFLDEAEIQSGVSDPQHGVTLRHFRGVIEYFLDAG